MHWYWNGIEMFENGDNSSGGPPAPKSGAFGRFYLQELINSGGMADIWVATDPQGHHYALRKLKSQFRFDFVTRRRFQRGCDILARIHNHQNVIQYFEHGKKITP